MELILDIFTGICFFIGSLSIIIGACGLIKLPDVFSRIHAAGMIDTGGTAFFIFCLLYTSPSPRDRQKSRMPWSA